MLIFGGIARRWRGGLIGFWKWMEGLVICRRRYLSLLRRWRRGMILRGGRGSWRGGGFVGRGFGGGGGGGGGDLGSLFWGGGGGGWTGGVDFFRQGGCG